MLRTDPFACEAGGMPDLVRTLVVFVLAGAAEIFGGWLMWQWLREGRPWLLGIAGAVVLAGYGLIATLQKESEFGRVYAAYGGVFIAMSLGWGIVVDGWRPDRWDLAGAAVAVAGMALMMFAPRSG